MIETWKELGATIDENGENVTFVVFSGNATRIDLYLYCVPFGAQETCSYTLARSTDSIWRITLPISTLRESGIRDAIYYGYRAWGPNWPYHPDWVKGSLAGFGSDVDDRGNRFNPNKLLLDPYAREISHDPMPRLAFIDPNEYADDFYSGEPFRTRDTGALAPKGILLSDEMGGIGESFGAKPCRHFKDDIIYEVHLRGFTMLDPAIPPELRGTYRGAALKAPYLQTLGVTAVEFLPVQAFANEQNDDGDPRGDNYWGYMTLAYFAPNRRYASDRAPGGPTREFRDMVRAFHDRGIKVFIDVTYNHTGEGLLKRATDSDDSRQEDTLQFPECAALLLFRGLDNASYYVLRSNPVLDGGRTCTRYQDNSGCGGNLNVRQEAVRNLVLDSLRYWSQELGVDGFRFDLAPVLGNELERDGFRFAGGDAANILNRAAAELPARSEETLEGVDLIAEPWALGDGTYQLGNFPQQWSEWNDVYRDSMRRAANKVGVELVTPAQIANALSGSSQQFHRKREPVPWQSVNYMVSHDGHTLRDLYSYTAWGLSWDHGGSQALQRQAVRNAFALLMLSSGVPMIMAGDEMFRTLSGRTNTSAEDDDSVYLPWHDLIGSESQTQGIYDFARHIIAFRRAHASLRPGHYFAGRKPEQGDLPDVSWYGADGEELSGGYWGDGTNRYLGMRIDARKEGDGVSSIFLGYNWGAEGAEIRLPANLPGRKWYRVCDTARWMEGAGNWDETGTIMASDYRLHGRSIVVLVEN